MLNIAINGFGRIGKNFLRVILTDKEAQAKLVIRAINIGSADLKAVRHSFVYDTIMGKYPYPVRIAKDILYVTDSNGHEHEVTLISELDPLRIDWKKFGIDWVVDATGKFTHREGAEKHIVAGAQA